MSTSEQNLKKKTQSTLEITLSPLDKASKLYEKYKVKFPNTFLHNLFWKLFVDETRKLTDAAFTPIVKSGYTELGIADRNEKGYQPTCVVFDTHDYDEALIICNELNQDVFGINEDEASLIVISSMSK